ncbi:MAG: MmgE/PrpD family protein [Betaproteobacteria bacterium]|nr:MmgE/PrpD family protein [Betaproteobacteria bacterium]
MPPVTAQLARFAAALRWDDLPPDVRRFMPVLLVDIFRAGAVGYDMPWTRKVRDLHAGSTGPRRASVLYSDVRMDVVRAAFVNGTACGSLDWDDAHVAAILHPGIVVWPAALAVAETAGSSGNELLAAVAAGYEVAIRVGMSIQPEHSLRGFQGTPACGVFGAAAACARLLQLDVGRTRDALGIAATFACGLSQFFVSGSDIKRFHAGKAAANGMEAALLAQAGLTGPPDAIEGTQGFARAFSDRFDPETAVSALGEDYRLSWVSLKPHAVSVRMQAAIEAAAALALSSVTVDAVLSMEIGVHGAMMGKLTSSTPGDQQQAQLSTPFAVALALMLAPERGATLALSTDDFNTYLHHPVVRGLAGRATCVVDAEVERLTTREAVPARVTCVLKDGSRRERFVQYPKGCPQNPIGLEEVCARFRNVAASRVAAHEIDTWLEQAMNVERLPNVTPLLALRAANTCGARTTEDRTGTTE